MHGRIHQCQSALSYELLSSNKVGTKIKSKIRVFSRKFHFLRKNVFFLVAKLLKELLVGFLRAVTCVTWPRSGLRGKLKSRKKFLERL